ncbi:MAG: hypothetical protein ACXW4Q_00260 [Anaerolineales bacterium]
MTKETVKLKTKSLRGIENCRVIEIGVEKFAECLQQGPNICSHALPFGYCFLCQHPRLAEIIENTKRAQPALEPLK